MLPKQSLKGKLAGRVWCADMVGPSVVILRDGRILDVPRNYPTPVDFLNSVTPGSFDALDGEDTRADPDPVEFRGRDVLQAV